MKYCPKCKQDYDDHWGAYVSCNVDLIDGVPSKRSSSKPNDAVKREAFIFLACMGLFFSFYKLAVRVGQRSEFSDFASLLGYSLVLYVIYWITRVIIWKINKINRVFL